MNAIMENEVTVQDVEQAADILIRVMVALTEKRLNTAGERDDPTTPALAQASLAVRAGIRSFILIERLRGQ
jgi:hypothetical protein